MKVFYRLLLIAGLALILFGIWMATPSTIQEVGEEGDKAQSIQGRFDQEFIMTVDPELNLIPRDRLLKAYQIAERKRLEKAGAVPIYWNERGPSNIGGRTRSILIDANDPTNQTVWAAGVSGGLWRTTNIDANPVTWNNINDFFNNLVITSIAQDPTNSNILYFGTGETGFSNIDATRGLGVWQSTDGGTSWEQIPSPTDGGAIVFSINKVFVDGTGTVYVATSRGLYSSDNIVGNGWTKELGIGGLVSTGTTQENVQDFEIASDGSMYAGINRLGVYRADSNNDNWQLVGGGLPNQGFGRIELTTAPSNANVIYAAYADTTSATSGECLSVYRSTDGGSSWAARSCPGNLGDQCWYDFIFAVDPTDPTRVWLGGVGLSVSSDGGNDWSQVNGGHADYHALVYDPTDNSRLLVGNDGGIYQSTNADQAAPSVVDKNRGYNVTQFYSAALHPEAGVDFILGGTQDNGTQQFDCAGICATVFANGSDGGPCFIDDDNGDIQIVSQQDRVFRLSTTGGGPNNFSTILSTNENAFFITPAAYDDGANILYVSDGPDTLFRVSDIGGTNTVNAGVFNQFGGNRVSTLTVSPNTPNRLFVGVQNGGLFILDNANQNNGIIVTTLTNPWRGSFYISSIAVEDGDDNHLIAAITNYGAQDNLFESMDGGVTWTSIQGDLPDMPVRDVLFHPFDSDQAIIATELGVWTTDDLDGTATEWFPTNTYGLANVRTDELQYRSSDHQMVVATHGRGMYTTDYFTEVENCVPSLVINGTIASGLYMAEDFINSDGTIADGRQVVFQAGNTIRLQPGFQAFMGSYFIAAIAGCTVPEDSDDLDELTSPTFDPKPDIGLTAYPNPTTFELTVELRVPNTEWYSLEVRSLTGQLIETIHERKLPAVNTTIHRLDASRYAGGFYTLVLRTRQEVQSYPFVVAR